jgi:perosamine synthetase
MSGKEPKMIPIAAPIIGEREIAYVTDAVRSGWVSSIGPYIDRFEQDFARYLGVRHAVAVSNGTVALHLALHAMGLGPGDEVIVPDLTFAATAHTVLQTGATPVFADVSAETWCLDPRAVERALTPRTRAIVPVHLFGHPADMPAISALARASGHGRVRVLEDAAEAHGASIGGVKAGALGDMGAFSFYGNKLMTTGEGGMLTTDDDALARRCRFLKDHGMSPERRYFHTELAFNYRMTNLQAAVGCAQLERIDTLIAAKRRIFDRYADALAGLDGLRFQTEAAWADATRWFTTTHIDPDRSATTATRLRACLAKAGIQTGPPWTPLHLTGAHYRAAPWPCPVAETLGRHAMHLPCSVSLTDAQQDRVIDAVRTAVASLSRN